MTTINGWGGKMRLDQIGTVFSGSTPSTIIESFWDGNIVWVTPNDLAKLDTPYLADSERRITEKGLNGCSAQLLPAGSLVISSRAPIGYVAIPIVPFCTNQGCKSLRLKSGFHSEFVYYNMLFNIDELKKYGGKEQHSPRFPRPLCQVLSLHTQLTRVSRSRSPTSS